MKKSECHKIAIKVFRKRQKPSIVSPNFLKYNLSTFTKKATFITRTQTEENNVK